MIVYHVITTYHLLCAMTLQSVKKEDAILLVPISITQKYPHYQSLSGELFRSVIQYDAIYRYKNSAERTQHYFSQLLPTLDDETEIYIWGAQYSFGIYAAEQNIPFIFCEEATGMMSRRRILEHIDELNPNLAGLYPYVQELGLYTGNCPSIKTLLCNFSAQLPGFEDNNCINFSVVDGLFSLNEDEREKIISFFVDLRELSIPENSTIIFTQPLANLRLATFEDEVLLYQILVDYFFNNRALVIKPHPDDLICYSKIFPDAVIVHERFPSEFLPFLLDNPPACVATIYSTAVYNLRGHYPEVFELDQSYEKDFVRMHRYYMALKIAGELRRPVYCLGTNRPMTEKLWERVGLPGAPNTAALPGFTLPDGPCTVIVDDIGSKEDADRSALQALLAAAGENTAFIFVNSQRDYCWYSIDKKDLWDHMTPIVLQKILRDDAPEEDFYESLRDEVMFLYSKNLDTQKRVNEMSEEKQLPHAGINISKMPLTNEEERIKVLEGILEATEQRLLYYIERVKELEKKGR